MKTKPMKHQKKGVKRAAKFGGRVILADDMGLGKSFQALLFDKLYNDEGPLIIICPASLKWNWANELKIHFGLPSNILSGRKPPKSIANRVILPPRKHATIVNYDILDGWLDYLIGLDAGFLVIDEIHMIGNMERKRYQNVKAIARGGREKEEKNPIRLMMGLSGTPFENRPADLWPILNLLRPDLYKSFWKYSVKYCRPHKRFGRWMHDGAKDMKKLNKKLRKTMMIRRLKKDVLKDLPDKIRSVVPLELSDPAQYEFAARDLLGWLREYHPTRVKAAEKAEAFVRYSYLKQLAARLKMTAFEIWLDRFLLNSDEKMIIFGTHRKILEPLFEKYKSQSSLLLGGMTQDERKAAVDQLNKDPNCRLSFINMKAGGVGLNCTGATNVSFIEFGWHGNGHLQCEDRAYRIGQKNNVMCRYFTGINTIEQDIAKLLLSKHKAFNDAIDDGSGEDLDILQELIKGKF